MEQQQASGVNKNNRKPNFLIVGAAKAGTTSLAKYLGEHPDIFIPEQKELRFFVKDIINNTNIEDPSLKGILNSSVLDEAEYFKLFEVPEKIAGEASVHYLYHFETAIANIKKYVGDVPIIIMLRNPVKRALSNYEYLYNSHKSSLEKEFSLESDRINKNFNSFWFYKQLGLYSTQVKAYLDSFTNVKIIIFEEFIKDTKGQMNEIYKFLGVLPITLEYQVFNKSSRDTLIKKILFKLGLVQLISNVLTKEKKNKLKHFLRRLLISEKKSQPSDKFVKEIYSYYEKDVAELEVIIGKDLSFWKMKANMR